MESVDVFFLISCHVFLTCTEGDDLRDDDDSGVSTALDRCVCVCVCVCV